MPIERQRWQTVVDWARGNVQLRRTVDVLDASARVAVLSVATTSTVALTYPATLVLVATSGGNVTLTLPPAASVPGFRVEVKKQDAANTVTLQGDGTDTIDGAATLAWGTRYQSYSVISDGGRWHVV